MSNRTAIVASAFTAGLVTLFSITSPAGAAPDASEAAPAKDECLAAPKATTPKGAHWYYRVEKGTKRKCWYLADEVAKVKKAATPAPASSDTAEQDAAPPAQAAPAPKQEAARKSIQKSVANARAELTAGSPDEDQSLAESTWPPLPPSADASVRDDSQAAAVQPAAEPSKPQGWNIASRWPESKTVASAEQQPAASTPEPAQPPSPALTPDRLAAAAAAATPAPVAQPQPANAVPAADAANPLNFDIRVLLSVLVGILALAAIIGPMIFRYLRPRREERTFAQRRPIWDMNTSGGIIRQDNPRMPPPAQYADNLPEPRVLDEAVDELEHLLARASRRSAA